MHGCNHHLGLQSSYLISQKKHCHKAPKEGLRDCRECCVWFIPSQTDLNLCTQFHARREVFQKTPKYQTYIFLQTQPETCSLLPQTYDIQRMPLCSSFPFHSETTLFQGQLSDFRVHFHMHKYSVHKLEEQDGCRCNSLKTEWPGKYFGGRLHSCQQMDIRIQIQLPNTSFCWTTYKNDCRAAWGTTIYASIEFSSGFVFLIDFSRRYFWTRI